MKAYFIPFFLVLFLMTYSSETYAQETKSKQDIAAEKYKMFCAVCHGVDGKLNINGASDLSKSKLTKKGRIRIITKGKGLMTPFKGILSEDEIKDIAKYLGTMKK